MSPVPATAVAAATGIMKKTQTRDPASHHQQNHHWQKCQKEALCWFSPPLGTVWPSLLPIYLHFSICVEDTKVQHAGLGCGSVLACLLSTCQGPGFHPQQWKKYIYIQPPEIHTSTKNIYSHMPSNEVSTSDNHIYSLGLVI